MIDARHLNYLPASSTSKLHRFPSSLRHAPLPSPTPISSHPPLHPALAPPPTTQITCQAVIFLFIFFFFFFFFNFLFYLFSGKCSLLSGLGLFTTLHLPPPPPPPPPPAANSVQLCQVKLWGCSSSAQINHRTLVACAYFGPEWQ